MNLFGVGPLEIVVILVVALIFVGPERLPRLAADLARTIREIRKYTGSLAAEFQEVVKDVEKQTDAERGVWKDVSEGIGGATKQVTEAVRTVRHDVNTALADTSPPTNGAATSGATTAPEDRSLDLPADAPSTRNDRSSDLSAEPPASRDGSENPSPVAGASATPVNGAAPRPAAWVEIPDPDADETAPATPEQPSAPAGSAP
jgi:sec-independent protein translocase protein TatB